MTRQCLMNFQNEMIWFSPKQRKEENYIEKPSIELSSENCYKKLDHYLTQEHTRMINNVIETFQQQEQILPKHICDNLRATKVRTPHLYITPKVHKKYQEGEL